MYVHVFYAEAIVKDVAKNEQISLVTTTNTSNTYIVQVHIIQKNSLYLLKHPFFYSVCIHSILFSTIYLKESCKILISKNERKAKRIKEWVWLVVVGGSARSEAHQQQN